MSLNGHLLFSGIHSFVYTKFHSLHSLCLWGSTAGVNRNKLSTLSACLKSQMLLFVNAFNPLAVVAALKRHGGV